MLRVTFPKTRVPVIERFFNKIATHGDILTPKERSYAEFLTKELRENVDPWTKDPEINDMVIADIQKEFVQKVKKEEPLTYRGIVRNVKDYVYKDAQYHFNRMSDPFIQSKLNNICPATDKVLENAKIRDKYWAKLEQIIGEPLQRNESWEDLELRLREKHFSCKQRNKCKSIYQQAYKYDVQRVDSVIERENQIAANEEAAKQYGFWKSYDYVYNMPQ